MDLQLLSDVMGGVLHHSVRWETLEESQIWEDGIRIQLLEESLKIAQGNIK